MSSVTLHQLYRRYLLTFTLAGGLLLAVVFVVAALKLHHSALVVPQQLVAALVSEHDQQQAAQRKRELEQWLLTLQATEPVGTTTAPDIASLITRYGMDRYFHFLRLHDASGKLLYQSPGAGSDRFPSLYRHHVQLNQGLQAEFVLDQRDFHHAATLISQQYQQQGNQLWLLPLSYLLVMLLLTVAALLLARHWSRQLARPLDQLLQRSRDVADGQHELPFIAVPQAELAQLGEALEAMRSRLHTTHEKNRALAYYDPLTSLPNRRMLQEFLTAQIERAEASTLAIVLIDIDDFKQINDTAGHEAGDELLCLFANRISRYVEQRYTPIGAHSLLSRLGGDEFVVVLPDIIDEQEAVQAAAKLISSLEAPFEVYGGEYRIGSSMGIAFAPRDGSDLNTLLKHADTAMYRAKQLGKNQAVCFEPAMNSELLARMKLIADIRVALEQEQLFLVYQPLWAMDGMEIIGAEVLLRWEHPERGLISPAEFIPVIEQTELIVPVTEWVLSRACLDMASLRFRGEPLKVAVNFSGHLLAEQSCVEMIKQALAHSRLDPSQLTVEITETAMMADVTSTMAILSQIRELGAQIWVDDFGTGYSSLSYLQKLPLNGLKIDRSFVSALDEHQQAAELVGGVISLAHSLQLKTVAEGVETETQQSLLDELDSDYVQGFLLARPLPFAGLVTLLEQRTPSTTAAL